MQLRRLIILPLMGILFSSCLFWDDGPDYPPLKDGEIVGCWVEVKPVGASCWERCFSKTGTYHSTRFNEGNERISQDSGKWIKTERNHVAFNGLRGAFALYPYNSGPVDFSSTGGGGDWWRGGNKLYANYSGLNETKVLIPSDSTNNCGPHWQFFKKPADWELD